LNFTKNGDAAWKSSGVGPGKRFTKAELARGMSRKTRSLKSCRRPSKEMQLPEEEELYPSRINRSDIHDGAVGTWDASR
jgi:hypothetical protein